MVPPLTFGEGILVADLDLKLNLVRKRLMDSVGHFSRPELLRLLMTNPATAPTVATHKIVSLEPAQPSSSSQFEPTPPPHVPEL